MGAPATVSTWIIDVDETSFQRDVIQRSRTVPVVVDFWAAWCGPCRSLGPILEGLAQEYGGRFILARLNVDENQRLAAQYNIQGIPAVKGFRAGRVADEFVGALPRPAVRQFIEKLVPDELQARVGEGQSLLAAGQAKAAEAAFRQVLAGRSDHAGAMVGLAQAQLAQDQVEAALASLEGVPQGTPEAAQAAQLRKMIGFRQAAAGLSESDLRARVQSDPADLGARYALGSFLTGQERYPEALEEYLEIIRRDRGAERQRAREAMLYIFEVLGEDPVVRAYRNRLASLLFA